MYKYNNLNYESEALINLLSLKSIDIEKEYGMLYLNKLNSLLNLNNYDYRYTKEELINHIDIFPLDIRADILYNLGGVLNHESFINSINGDFVLNNEITRELIKEYGSISNFKNTFKNTAFNLVGSGHTYLVIDRYNKFNIINLSNEEVPYSFGFIPIITLDLWEHAYLYKYNLNKNEYVNNFLSSLDFKKINEIYIKHKK
ncbi:MAG: Fe-Mn family superoxide dismutase [Bacilli bacterium]